MSQLSEDNGFNVTESVPNEVSSQAKFDLIARGVATGVVVSIIIHTSKSILEIMAKNPLVVFGVGFGTGCFVHKYRKEIILTSTEVAKQSKDFASRQQKSFAEMIAKNDTGVN